MKHYATYRDVYVNTVCNFVNNCLKKQNKTEDEGNIDENDINFQMAPIGLTKRVVLPHEATK